MEFIAAEEDHSIHTMYVCNHKMVHPDRQRDYSEKLLKGIPIS